MLNARTAGILLAAVQLFSGRSALADSYSDTVTLFKNAGESASFFNTCYGYAVFPTIGKAGLVVGGAHGKGRVYVHGKYLGDASVTQLSVGLQAGGQAYSQIVFLEDERGFKDFTSGHFELGADDSAVAMTAAAHARAVSVGARVRARVERNG